jgi:hypothetical protein
MPTRREQLFALGTFCTYTKGGRSSWGLDSGVCPCSRRFGEATAGARKRILHRAALWPPREAYSSALAPQDPPSRFGCSNPAPRIVIVLRFLAKRLLAGLPGSEHPYSAQRLSTVWRLSGPGLRSFGEQAGCPV